MIEGEDQEYITKKAREIADLIEEKLIDPVKDPKNGGFISEETLIKIEYRNNQFVTEINK